MTAQITPFFPAKGGPANTRPLRPLTVACCVYFLVLCLGLLKTIPIFAALFAGLSVELPFPTNILIVTYRWSVPLFYAGASAVAIIKQFVQLEGLRRRAADASRIFAGIVFVPLVILTMYLPLFVLTHKLHQMR